MDGNSLARAAAANETAEWLDGPLAEAAMAVDPAVRFTLAAPLGGPFSIDPLTGRLHRDPAAPPAEHAEIVTIRVREAGGVERLETIALPAPEPAAAPPSAPAAAADAAPAAAIPAEEIFSASLALAEAASPWPAEIDIAGFLYAAQPPLPAPLALDVPAAGGLGAAARRLWARLRG